ncbi:hypothetical protein [[Phormidium] sp. ETS-05]|uniref:hypothetical protein n=1 Tax=[Phormidium] sp. ETS-05 TaxID=222819 RepID=UPI0018EF3633|nr:hypothetical protein [[Phormidium] sp. ETS-05]
MTTIVMAKTPPSLASQCKPVGRVEEGEVRIDREESGTFTATAGDQICAGDLLTAQNQAKIYCNDDEYSYPIQPGEYGVYQICPKPRQRDLGPEDNDNPIIPHILSPRNTAILEPKPRLRWQTVAEETDYTIKLAGVNGEVWQDTVNSTDATYCDEPITRGDDYIEIVYCGEPLAREVDYRLTVTTQNSEAEDKTIFSVLSEADAGEVKKIIDSQNLNNLDNVLSLIPIYLRFHLKGEAIVTLEALVNNDYEAAVIYSRLGGLFDEVDLRDQAIEYFQKAADKAAASKDFTMAALNRKKLAEIYVIMDKIEEAINQLNQAYNLYLNGGKTQEAQEVKELLEQLSNQ